MSSDSESSLPLERAISRIFLPVDYKNNYTTQEAQALACAIHAAAHAYNEYIEDVHKSDWLHVTRMLENFEAIFGPNAHSSGIDSGCVISQLGDMRVGDALLLPTPYHATILGIIFRRQDRFTLYEAFDAIGTDVVENKVECSHTELSIPNVVFDEDSFQSQLAGLLHATREVPLSNEILGVFGPVGLTMRRSVPVGQRIVLQSTHFPCLWSLIRAAIQSSLDRSLGRPAYKAFMLFSMCKFGNDGVNSKFSSSLLHSMSAKILRRFRKLPLVSLSLRDAMLYTCTRLSQTLHRRWLDLQTIQRPALLWDPSQLDLVKDVQPSLSHVQEYISNSVTNHDSGSPRTPFFASNHPRGSLNDFLSQSHPSLFSFDNYYHRGESRADIYIALFDIDQAVTKDIDGWLACVTDIDMACKQLELLIHRCHRSILDPPSSYLITDPDRISIVLLTIIELWVALDKLVIKEIPILADYSPEIPKDLLSGILLRDTVSIDRFSRAFQYITIRHAQAHPGWSAFSDEFAKHSFPCRYYDRSSYLQHLHADIKDTLPHDPLYAKVVVFELQCPTSFDSWRSVTYWIADIKGHEVGKWRNGDIQVCDIPTLRPHAIVGRSSFSLYSSRTAPQRWDALYYIYSGLTLDSFRNAYELSSGPYAGSMMRIYINTTAHTSNEVMAAQANCERNVPLHELIAFANLRSGGSLQWFNILRELRSRTLDFRRQDVYLLLAQASAQVGSLDSTRQLLWHQDLEDASFCQAILDELQSLFIDIGLGSLDGPPMATISLLAAILVSRSTSTISQRAMQLVRRVRRKTFYWVRELLYDVWKSPTDEEGLGLLRDMAAVCRSTFDVGCAAHDELFQSEEDIEVALSCAMLIATSIIPPVSSGPPSYSQVLLNRDRHLSLILEGSFRDAIEANVSNIGVDRAVQVVWPGYRPSPCQWKPLESPNSRWLKCHTAPADRDRRAQTVHINLLDGSLLVDGKQLGHELPSAVTSSEDYETLFGSRVLMVVTSDLPGMDFVTVSVISRHYIHFAVREHNGRHHIVIRAQNEDTDDIFEYIPRRALKGDLPTSIIANHVSWLNLSTSIIQIRPIEKLWEQSSDNWEIHLHSEHFCVTKGNETLVDKHSPTWEMVSNRFRCLDDPEHIIVAVSPFHTTQFSSLRITITLSRYGIVFFVNEANDLESRDFKDMVYDEDQCIGTLFGLVDRLILRPKTLIEADLVPKIILIPYSDSVEQHGHDVLVNLESSELVRYYTYQEDRDLGCLKGIPSFPMESRLFLARLHGLANGGWRPDPLTGRTGVEEAVSLLWLSGHQNVREKWIPELQSPQMRLASREFPSQNGARDMTMEAELPTAYALEREPYLFPSSELTVAAGVHSSHSLGQLFLERPPPKLPARSDRSPSYVGCHRRSPSHTFNIDILRELFSSLRTDQTAPPFQSHYVAQLHSSAYHFKTQDPIAVAWKHGIEKFRQYYVECRTNYTKSLDMVKMALGPNTEFERILEQCGQWPRVTPFILFRCLAFNSPIELPDSWKKCLMALALLALDVQRARRLLRFALENLEEELYKELENEGCDERDLVKHPDWLLIQLQGNFLIRRVQADIAKEMISPRSGENTITQVNMGEGKSSVIVPICAAALADGNKLVRVLVPKALIPQTLQMLTDRLCGLVNRSIHLLEFSRDRYVLHRGSRELVVGGVERLHEWALRCRDECDIIVTRPEDVLSFKLTCVEKQLLEVAVGFDSNPGVQQQDLPVSPHHEKEDGLSELPGNNFPCLRLFWMSNLWIKSLKGSMSANALMKFQIFLDTYAQDILDESDDVLSAQFHLIYATGHQNPFEGSPGRWVVVQKVLGLVQQHIHLLSSLDSHTIRCDPGSPGSFPHIHILKAEGGEQLISLIAQDVLEGRLSNITFHSELGLRQAIREFMLREDIHPDTVKMVEKYARQSTIWSSLLLLRGLLAHKILLYALTQRRWRVDYGLDLTSPPRTMLSIPYRAKDVQSKTAEFGHPDITILLTCLAYYYRGLSELQLRTSFELLLQEDDPSSEYATWLRDCSISSVPGPLLKLSGVNIRSLEQWQKYLVPLFGRNKRAIDLYLAKIVFARHAKEFPLRISGSYWDIAARKNHPVTGLAGTSDRQYLLPTSIAQDNPDHLHQVGTNAQVLASLLQLENASYMVTTDANGERWTTRKLLRMIVAQDPEIRVLLDVGAQILDLTNLELAKAWLDCTPATDTIGAIYFSEDDEVMALERNGTMRLLSLSPLAQQLHRCVAYLDDVHTRGIDIKFPLGFRAAVTLGHKVTKDRLVQGCMRMRKLGHGHSVMFFAPHEVDQRIRGLVAKENPSLKVTTADILHWAIHETWDEIQRLAPCWAQQGMSHQSRTEAWSRYCEKKASAKELAAAWIQPERKSLVDMYMPSNSPTAPFTELPRQIRERCENLGVLLLRDVQMDEEQEREVSREIEREREVEKPPVVSPATHFLHPDVIQFVRTGVVPSKSRRSAFLHVFSTGVTGAPNEPRAWSPNILATADFCKTVQKNESVQGKVNNYLRPVQWVISGKMNGRDALVIPSPFEVDQLMPEIRVSEHVHLHLYIARTTERMQPSDDLRLYCVPPLPSNWTPPWALIDQLNIFAGQLYLSDYASYVRVCRFLGVHAGDGPHNANAVVMRNWLSNPNSTRSTEIKNRLEGTPLPFVMRLLTTRRGADFSKTHMGRILDGWPLTTDDFPFSSDPATSMTSSLCEQKQGELDPASGRDGPRPRMTRKWVSDSVEPKGCQTKRRRPN